VGRIADVLNTSSGGAVVDLSSINKGRIYRAKAGAGVVCDTERATEAVRHGLHTFGSVYLLDLNIEEIGRGVAMDAKSSERALEPYTLVRKIARKVISGAWGYGGRPFGAAQEKVRGLARYVVDHYLELGLFRPVARLVIKPQRGRDDHACKRHVAHKFD